MRIWGRITNPDGSKTWKVVETDAQGFNDWVYVTNLAQVLLLNLNESPFFADWGIPAQPAVIQQVQPDYYVALTQKRFAPRFAALTVAKLDDPTPHYRINVTTHQGVKAVVSIPV